MAVAFELYPRQVKAHAKISWCSGVIFLKGFKRSFFIVRGRFEFSKE